MTQIAESSPLFCTKDQAWPNQSKIGGAMRRLLIAIVAIVTGLTFYSAFTYKSEIIQADITSRVTADLAAKNAQAVGIAVDGRDVTLSGVVYDAAAEKLYLDTADKTYGALGPIDGLTYLADTGHITAVKTATGLTLTGTVPSDDLRQALLAKASAATNGTVTDALILAGPAADWQKEADFGLTSLAGLTEGAMSVAPGSLVLSGTEAGNAGSVAQSVAARGGWQTYVSAPVATTASTAETDGLKAAIAQSATTITDLTASVAAAQTKISTLSNDAAKLTADRDDLAAKLAQLTTTLSTDQTNATDQVTALQTDLAAATASLALRDKTIADMTTQIAQITADFAGFKSDTATSLAEKDAKIASLSANAPAAASDADALLADLQTKITIGDTKIASLTEDLANSATNLSAATDKIALLTAALAARDTAQTAPAPSAPNLSMAKICTDRAASVIDGSQIKFSSGTANIAADSVPLLERITGIALACANDGLSVEIGGHTDSQGSDAANQRLSDARAKSVVAFMTARGVPIAVLQAKGYGETQPIADDATSAGRAANRRISFNWLAR